MQAEALETEILNQFVHTGLVKFGNFKLKSGVHSNIYCDLRVLISYPHLLEELVRLIIARSKDLNFDLVCGVPYTALPMGTLFSNIQKVPMVMRRKEVKNYGTGKMIEGVFKPGQKCLVIEDVVTSGSSVLETVRALRNEGLIVEDVITVIDRQQGGEESLAAENIRIHSLFSLSELLELYHGEDSENSLTSAPSYKEGPGRGYLPFEERAGQAHLPVVKKLFQLMASKKTNLCFRLDVTSYDEMVETVEQMGPHICLLKSHIDLVKDFSPAYVKKMKELADKHHFLIFEDRKLCDIGSTVLSQFTEGVFSISSYADFVNAFIFPGEGILKALTKVIDPKRQGLLLMAQMSSEGNMLDAAYTKKVVEMMKLYPELVSGFICQQRICPNPEMIFITPGVKIGGTKDGLGQKYRTPEQAIAHEGNDVVIVGRGIFNSEHPEEAAKEYRRQAWEAYESRISGN